MDNETWLIEEGARVIHKRASLGFDQLTRWERLVYALWVADYGMRNAGRLETAKDVCEDFQTVALEAAEALSLAKTRSAFSMTLVALEENYFDQFEEICEEIRKAE
jgi:hypothetical protein